MCSGNARAPRNLRHVRAIAVLEHPPRRAVARRAPPPAPWLSDGGDEADRARQRRHDLLGHILAGREDVAEEIVATLTGSIGLVAAVPITTALAAALAVRLPASAVPDTATRTDPSRKFSGAPALPETCVFPFA